MFPKRVTCLALAMSVVCPVLAAQDAPVQPGQPEPAAAARKATAANAEEVSFSVTGLTLENAAKARQALAEIVVKTYACPDCGATAPKPGTCAECDVELETIKHPLLHEAAMSVDKGTASFRINPGRQVRLSQIEKALKGASVRIERDKLALKAPLMLVFEGGASTEDATALEKVFGEAKLLTGSPVTYDKESREIRVAVRPGTEVPAFARLTEAGKKSGRPLQPADVVWGSVKKG